ncbi:MFS transporter [Streptomyces flavidovirens]|uniref:MFS transporter n=1 Tax=Streptomyces flavidovirens TaxID=67298 RepID=UPI00343E32DB
MAALIAMFEGYDLSVYGATVPALLREPGWNLSKGEAGVIGSLVAAGMLIGAGIAGAAGRHLGTRRLLLSGLSFFSLCMLGSALADGPDAFAASRLFAGIGLGVVLPTLTAVVGDMSAPHVRARNIAITMAGSCVGSLGAPLLGSWLLPDVSFRVLYLVGAAALLTVVPWAFLRLPESPLYLVRTGRADEAARTAARFGLPAPQPPAASQPRHRFLGLGPLLHRPLVVTTLLFWLMTFCGLLLIFGFSTWLPTLMQTGGFSIGSALTMTCLSWIGAGVGMVPGGVLADRLGPKRVVTGAFLVGAAGLLVISRGPASWILYLCLLMCGFGLLACQAFVNAYLIGCMPADLRVPAVGWSLSVGRLGAIVGPSLGGRILDSGLGLEWNFYFFAATAAVGATAAIAVPTRPVGRPAPRRTTAPIGTADSAAAG